MSAKVGVAGNRAAVRPQPRRLEIALEHDDEEPGPEQYDVPALCPRCALAPPIEDGRTGFCASCAANHTTERLIERDTAERLQRLAAWRDRTLDARRRHNVVKQERKRLHHLMRPRTPVPAMDPWEIGRLGLHRITRLKTMLRNESVGAPVREELRCLEEIVRALAWGPHDNL